MKILVLNSGSSSIKFQLFLIKEKKSIASGLIEQIGEANSKATIKTETQTIERACKISNHHEGLDIMNELLKQTNIIESLSQLDGIGHRIVHGGSSFSGSALITDEVLDKISKNIPLAPLHNPGHIAGIKDSMKKSANVPHVAVFDTVFHQSMPKYAYTYALPYELSQKFHIRKYGFHGTSYQYAAQQAAKMLNKDINELNAICLHLGNGASICAIKNGKSIDTSMGLSPLEGLIMGTRSGDLDPAVLMYLKNLGELNSDNFDDFLNKKSGLFGICGTNDMRQIEQRMMQNDEMAKLAFDMFCYRIKKYIGSYYAVLDRVDTIIFTGGIGENSNNVRAKICNELKHLGISIDNNKNQDTCKKERCIDDDNAQIKTLIIPTNEDNY